MQGYGYIKQTEADKQTNKRNDSILRPTFGFLLINIPFPWHPFSGLEMYDLFFFCRQNAWKSPKLTPSATKFIAFDTRECLQERHLLGRKTPRTWRKRIFLGKELSHPVHIPCQQVLPAYFSHAREMVDFLLELRKFWGARATPTHQTWLA